LNSVQVELREDAGGVEACFREESIRRVCAECEEGGDGGCVGRAGATHDHGEDVYLGTRLLVASEDVDKWGAFSFESLCGVGVVFVCAILPFPYLNTFNRGVRRSGVRVADEPRLEEADGDEFASGVPEQGG
jgi:hypothetical protein